MAHNTLKCQVCLTNFKSVCRFKTHVRSKEHRQKMIKVFQKDTFLQHGTFPHITLLDPLAIKQPIIGLSLLTACFSLDRKTIFYLCHVCEEKCPTDKIANHLFSGDHYSSYFNYTDPNVLKFAWLPSMNMWLTHKSQVSKEVRDKGPVTLQMLNLPQTLMKRLETSLYSEVMDILNENEALLKMLKATKPKRTMIQSYQKDSNRKHPLLGMQHLIECICVGPPEKRFYLCTLCNLTLATHTVIKHVLSFDHIFCYLKAWHPSTLMSKQCYINYTDVFASMMLDFAKQTEEIHGTANTDMKQVSLEPAEFRLVNSFCYAKALEKLESITKENKGSSLMTSIKPGNKLERRTVSAAVSVASSYKLHCQECSTIFETESQYSQHLSKQKHKEMLKKCFREAVRADGYDQTVKPHLDLCTYLRESMKQNKPVIGVSLVVACVCSEFQSEPVYVCFACEDCFPEPHLRQHFKSHKHVIRTLLYQNPWRLPFAWKNHLDGKILTSNALEEEKERGPNQMMLKVLDIPYRIFEGLIPPSYPKVMERLEKHHMLLKQEVPKRETYSKLKQNERFPLLGKKFLVMHSCHQHTKVGFLCLLCERRLSDGENESHVFSREHVAAFLDRFHPGSVSPSTDAETLLDLAKQAARIHPIANEQVIELDKPIWEPCSYHTLTFILASAKRRHGGGNLEPEITPKMKLFPRETLKEVDKDTQKNSVMKEESESKTSQKSTDNNDSLTNKISVELGSEIINKCGAESEETAGKGADKESPTPSDKESETRREALSKTSQDEIKNADSEMCPLTKEEKMDELSTKKPSGETPENCQDTDKDDRAETGKEESKSSKDVPIQLKSCMYQENERKRPNDMSEKPQEGTCSTSDKDMGGEMPLKRARLTSKEDASCEEPQKIPSGGPEGATTAANKGESDSHDTAKDEVSSKVTYQQAAHLWQYVKEKIREPVVGLSALLECHCDQHDPIYLCECCCLKIPEKDIINHVTGFDHQKQYLLGLQKIPPLPGKHQRKKIRYLAVLFEQDKGYGEAQVVDLCEEMYSNILKQNFNSAMQTVKALLAQQDSGCDLPSTSASSGVRPVQVSVTLHAQAEVQSAMDNIEVVEIVSDSEDSEAQPSSVTASMSVMTETTSKTTVPSESNVYIKMTGIKVPESGDNANTCLAVSRSGEDALSLHVPESGTNSQHKIAPNTTVEQSKKVITSKIEGASQTAAAPVSTVTTSTKPMIAVSGCTAISSSCTQNTTKSTAAVSKLTANTSSCTTAATKLSETADKSVAATSSGTTGTTQLTAANPSSSKTTTSAAPAPSCTTTTTKCRETTSKCSATTSSATRTTTKSTASTTIRTAATAKYTAATSKSTATTTTSSVTILNTTLATKSAAVSKPVSTVMHRDPRRATPLQPVKSQTIATNATTVTMANTSVRCDNSEVSAKTDHTKNTVRANADVPPHIHKSNPPATPHVTTAVSARSECKNSSTEPSHASTIKTKPSEHPPKIGLNQLIVVLCEGKQQVYCQLCSIRLKRSSHPSDRSHHYNYVKMKYPGWTAKPSESKLEKIVAHLAEVEKDVGSVHLKKVDVENDVYRELALLPENEAVERVKEIVRQRGLEVPSSTSDTLRQPVSLASPCEISSPDDGMYMSQNETPGLPIDNQPEQENKQEPQTLLVHVPGMKSSMKEVVDQSEESPSDRPRTDEGPGANDLIPDQLQSHLSLKNDPESVLAPSIQDTDMSVTVKQERFDPALDHVEVAPATQSPAAEEEKPHGCGHPPVTDSESAGTFAQTPRTCQETPQNGQQQESSDPEIPNTEKTSPIKSLSPDQFSSAAQVNAEQQNQSRPSSTEEHISKDQGCSPGPGKDGVSQALSSISVGEWTQGCSNLSAYLRVKEAESIIGLGSVWECRGISLSSFYLCESCKEMLSLNGIFQHMVSFNHQYKYLKENYAKFMWIWQKNLPLQTKQKQELFMVIVEEISVRERYHNMDAQVVLLGHKFYEQVRTAPFSEALELVQSIKKKRDLRVLCPPFRTPQQMDKCPEKRQEESHPVAALQTDQRSDDGARQEPGRHNLEEETLMAGVLDGTKDGRVSSPLDAAGVSSNDSAVSPFPGIDVNHHAKETCRSPSVPLELKPSVFQQQMPIPESQVKQEEVLSESKYSCTGNPEITQTLSVSPINICPPSRKRPADISVEALARICTSNPQLEDLLPAKCVHSSLQQQQCWPSPKPASESTDINPAAQSTHLSPKDKDMSTGSHGQNALTVSYDDLIALVNEKRSQMNVSPCKPAPRNTETTTSCARNSSGSGVEGRWDSKCRLVTATATKSPPSTSSLCSTTPPVVQRTNSNPSLSANDSSLEGCSTRDNLVVSETKAVSTMLPSASTTDRSELQYQRSVGAQNVFANWSQLKPNLINCVITNHNAGQPSQPQSNTQTDTTGVCQLPINAIITARSDLANQRFKGGYKGQDHAKVNRGTNVAHSFSTAQTADSSNTLAASGGYGQYNQMAYATNRHSSHLSPEAVGGHATPGNPSVYTGSLYQHQGYTASGSYPSQIYHGQQAIQLSLQSFGQCVAPQAAPGSVSLEMLLQQPHKQQQKQQQPQQQLQQQQQQQQQLYFSWTGATVAAGHGQVTSDAAYFGAVPLTIPANSSQRLSGLNGYSTQTIVPMQSSSNIITQNNPQAFCAPSVFHCPPTANREVTQAYVNSFFAPGTGASAVAPSTASTSSHATTS